MIQRRMMLRAMRLLSLLILLALASPAAADEPIRPDLWVADDYVLATVISEETLYIGGEFNRVGPNTGHGVPLDSASGLALATFPRANDDVYAAVPDGSGGWYIGGQFSRVGGVTRNNIAHILPDYSVDPAWDPNADDEVNALSVHNGIVYAGGAFTNIGGQDRDYIAALGGSGNATAWNPASDCTVYALAMSGDGNTVYAGGCFGNAGGAARNRIAALDAVTGNATVWNPDSDCDVNALAVSGDGSTVYTGGCFWNIGGATRKCIAALDAATGNATAWDPSANNSLRALALSPDGNTVYAGGFFSNIGGQTRHYIAALDANTNTNNAIAWNPDADRQVSALALSGDGSAVYAGGDFGNVGGQDRNHIAALDAATGSATPWNPNAEYTVRALAVSNGTVYAGGEFGSINMVTRNHIAALDLTTGAATAWDPDADDGVRALAVHNGTVYAGGDFGAIGGQTRHRVAALDAATGLATPWDPNADNWLDALAVSGDGTTVYAGGVFANIGGQPRSRIAALDAATGNATAWDPDADDRVRALVPSNGLVYVGGDFVHIGGQDRNYIAALDAASGAATAWDPNAEDHVDSMALSADGKTVYAGGRFIYIGGQDRHYIGAVDTGTGLATPFNPNARPAFEGHVLALAPSTDGSSIYAGGRFTSIGWPPRSRVAELDAVSGLATAWDPNAGDDVRTLALGEGVIYAGGEFHHMGGESALHLAGILLPGKIIIEKDTKPGGGQGFGFSQDIDGTGDFSLDDGQNKVFFGVSPGQYSITEHDPAQNPGRYDLTGLVCQDSDAQGKASTTDLGSRTATVNVDPGETVTCTFTNAEWGRIVIAKETEPDGDPASFSFHGDINAQLRDGESESRDVRPGAHTVQETVPKNWDLTAISCSDQSSSGDLGSGTATFRVAPGEEVTCTFTNTKRAKITVEKQTYPDGAEQSFAFKGAIQAQLRDGESTSKVVLPGTYQVTETLPDDWRLHLVVCDNAASTGDAASQTATFRAGPGEHVTCTFANAHKEAPILPATMVVAKETVPDGDPTRFTFQGDAAGAIGDGQRIIVTGLQPGTYTSRELVPQGWRLAAIQCDDADSSGDVGTATATFRLESGETVTCTFNDERLYTYRMYVPLVLR